MRWRRHLGAVTAAVVVASAGPAAAQEVPARSLPTPADALAAYRSPSWVDDVNYVRALGGLPPVIEHPSWSVQAAAHSRYMAGMVTLTHDQDPTSPFHTPGGAFAGRHGNVARGHFHRFYATLDWLTSAAHAFWLLNPAATAFGYGEATGTTDDGRPRWYATLQVNDGTTPYGDGATWVWPASGAVVPVTTSPARKYTQWCGPGQVGGVSVYVRSTHEPAIDGAMMTVDGEVVATCTFAMNHLWTVVMATDPTPHGAAVVVTFDGEHAPPPVTFSTMAAPALADAEPTAGGPLVRRRAVDLRSGELELTGRALDLLTEVWVGDVRVPVLQQTATMVRLDVRALRHAEGRLRLRAETWPGGPRLDAVLEALPAATAASTAATGCSDPQPDNAGPSTNRHRRGWSGRTWVPC